MSCRGSAALEYLGIVCAVAVAFGALLVVRQVTVERRAPVRPVEPIVRLLDLLRDPPTVVRRSPPRGVRPRVTPAPTPRVVVEVPRWFA